MHAHVVHVAVAQLLIPLADVLGTQPVRVGFVAPLAVPTLGDPVEQDAMPLDPQLAETEALYAAIDPAITADKIEHQVVEVGIGAGPEMGIAPPGRERDAGARAADDTDALGRDLEHAAVALQDASREGALKAQAAEVGHFTRHREQVLTYGRNDSQVRDVDGRAPLKLNILPDTGLTLGNTAAPGHVDKLELAAFRMREGLELG